MFSLHCAHRIFGFPPFFRVLKSTNFFYLLFDIRSHDSFTGIIEHGELWRLVSATFSHLDFMHILFNMSSLAGVAQMEALVQ